MSQVTCTGLLVCADVGQLRRVREHVADHIAATRAEPGCLRFTVEPTDDPMVWAVDECFEDDSAFQAHQRRMSGSAWAAATAGIERRYTIRGGTSKGAVH